MRTRRILAGGIAVLFAAPFVAMSAAEAHHGWSKYDSTNLLTFTGVVREVTIENPHGMLRLETPEKTWSIVLAPPSRLLRRGLPEGAIEVGDSVTVEGYGHQTVADELRAERITVNGERVEMR